MKKKILGWYPFCEGLLEYGRHIKGEFSVSPLGQVETWHKNCVLAVAYDNSGTKIHDGLFITIVEAQAFIEDVIERRHKL